MSQPTLSKERIREIVRGKVNETNILVAKTLIVFAVISLLFRILFQMGALKSRGLFVNMALVVTPCLFILCGVWCLIKKGRGIGFQYAFLAMLAMFWLEIDIMSGYKCKLLLPILVLISLRYYNKRITRFAYFVSVAVLLLSVWGNAYLYRETGLIDLNLVRFDEMYPTYITGFLYDNVIALNPDSWKLFINGIILTFIPNALFLTVVTVVAFGFMKTNLNNLLLTEDLASREANRRLELSDMKTKVMLSQVKPHFVYNTLSSIAMLCTKEPAKAKELTLDFSEYLRNNLDTLASEKIAMCSFPEELEHVKTYLNIESVRFGDRLKVVYDIKESNFEVPALSIQPIVENAVKHGLCKKPEGGTVTISSAKTGNGYLITVQDDGVGFDVSKIDADGAVHVGIANIEKRIALIHGKVEIESTQGVGTTVRVFVRGTEE